MSYGKVNNARLTNNNYGTSLNYGLATATGSTGYAYSEGLLYSIWTKLTSSHLTWDDSVGFAPISSSTRGNNTITFTGSYKEGTSSTKFLLSLKMAISGSPGERAFSYALAKNGVINSASSVACYSFEIGGPNYFQHVALNAVGALVTNDYIEIYGKANTADSTILISSCSLTIVEI